VNKTTVTVRGELIDISPRFWREGWGIGKIRTSDSKPKTIKITGILEGFTVGMHLVIEGAYKSSDYGEELCIGSIMVEEPNSAAGITQWLISRIPHIGPARAKAIADSFGDKLWGVLDTSPEELEMISGITKGRVKEIVVAWGKYKAELEKYGAYYKLGLSPKEAVEAEEMGIAASAIALDPFMLCLKIKWISFTRNLLIAARCGAPKDTESKFIAAVVHVLHQASQDGHTGVDDEYVETQVSALIGARQAQISEGVTAAIKLEHVIAQYELLMLPKYAMAEAGIASKIKYLLRLHGRHESVPSAGSNDQARPDTGSRSIDDAGL